MDELHMNTYTHGGHAAPPISFATTDSRIFLSRGKKKCIIGSPPVGGIGIYFFIGVRGVEMKNIVFTHWAHGPERCYRGRSPPPPRFSAASLRAADRRPGKRRSSGPCTADTPWRSGARWRFDVSGSSPRRSWPSTIAATGRRSPSAVSSPCSKRTRISARNRNAVAICAPPW